MVNNIPKLFDENMSELNLSLMNVALPCGRGEIACFLIVLDCCLEVAEVLMESVRTVH